MCLELLIFDVLKSIIQSPIAMSKSPEVIILVYPLTNSFPFLNFSNPLYCFKNVLSLDISPSREQIKSNVRLTIVRICSIVMLLGILSTGSPIYGLLMYASYPTNSQANLIELSSRPFLITLKRFK